VSSRPGVSSDEEFEECVIVARGANGTAALWALTASAVTRRTAPIATTATATTAVRSAGARNGKMILYAR